MSRAVVLCPCSCVSRLSWDPHPRARRRETFGAEPGGLAGLDELFLEPFGRAPSTTPPTTAPTMPSAVSTAMIQNDLAGSPHILLRPFWPSLGATTLDP